MSGVDPFAVLGVAPGAPDRELSAAYRRLAKRWHPDRAGGEDAERRMAEINAAYDLLRAEAQLERSGDEGPARGSGAWLDPAVRRALGHELLDALDAGEPVRLVCPVATWSSPRAILVLTDRRLLWLLDDVPVARVRSVAFRDIDSIERRLRRPRRRVATLTLQTIGGRRHSFSGLRPPTAAAIERRVREAVPRPVVKRRLAAD
jgi:curved DNA-binding protein CbpA